MAPPPLLVEETEVGSLLSKYLGTFGVLQYSLSNTGKPLTPAAYLRATGDRKYAKEATHLQVEMRAVRKL